MKVFLSSVFLCVHPNDSWPDKIAHLRLVEGKKEREKEREKRAQRRSFTEPNVLKLGGKKKKEKIIASIRYDESGDDEWRRLANVG